MKIYRLMTVSLMVFTLLFIYGFKKPVKKQRLTTEITKPLETNQQEFKQLDLAVPMSKSVLMVDGLVSQSVQQKRLDLFDVTQSKRQSLEMKGNIIMTQEPEAEKRKSADGAGILINIRH